MSEMTTRPTLRGTFGMTSSTHWLASQSAMAELEAGGNAFDAAIAGAFVLHVVEPHLNGPGRRGAGGLRHRRRPDAGGAVRPGRGSGRRHGRALPATSGSTWCPAPGRLAAAVPGAVDAWLMLGARPRHPLAARRPVVRRRATPGTGTRCCRGRLRTVATDGATVHRALADLGGALDPAAGACPQPWQLVANPAYADVLDRLVASGEAAGADREAQYAAARRAWREGFVAEAVDAFQRQPFQDSSGEAHAGRAHRGRHGGLERVVRAGRDPVVPRLRGRQDRPVGAGAGAAAVAGDARPAARRGARPGHRRRRARDHRGAQARLRRPGGVVRRRRRRAGRRAARPGVRRPAPRLWSGDDRLGGAAAGLARRPGAAPAPSTCCARSPAGAARRARVSASRPCR